MIVEPEMSHPSDVSTTDITPLVDGAVHSQVHLHRTAFATHLVLRGEIDQHTARTMWPQLHPILVYPPEELVVDLGDVQFMGSAGITMLLRLMAVVEGAGGLMRITNASPPVRRIVEIVGLTEHLRLSEALPA